MLVLQHKSFSLIKALSEHFTKQNTKKTLCTCSAHIHKHKDTFDKLINLHEI